MKGIVGALDSVAETVRVAAEKESALWSANLTNVVNEMGRCIALGALGNISFRRECGSTSSAVFKTLALSIASVSDAIRKAAVRAVVRVLESLEWRSQVSV